MIYDPRNDHYDALGLLPENANAATIKVAHRRLIKELHPDRASGDHERAARLNHARDVLLDPLLRRRYDELRIAHLRSESEKVEAKAEAPRTEPWPDVPFLQPLTPEQTLAQLTRWIEANVAAGRWGAALVWSALATVVENGIKEAARTRPKSARRTRRRR